MNTSYINTYKHIYLDSTIKTEVDTRSKGLSYLCISLIEGKKIIGMRYSTRFILCASHQKNMWPKILEGFLSENMYVISKI
jgi:hypothetical protein